MKRAYTLITSLLLFAFGATTASRAEIHFRLEGNIGQDVTDTLEVYDHRFVEMGGGISIGTLCIVHGEIVPLTGTLPEPTSVFTMKWEGKSSCSLDHIVLADGTTHLEGKLNEFGRYDIIQSGNPLAEAMTWMLKERNSGIERLFYLDGSLGVPTKTALAVSDDSSAMRIMTAHGNDIVGAKYQKHFADKIQQYSPYRGLELLDMLNPEFLARSPWLQERREKMLGLVAPTSEGMMYRDFAVEQDGKTIHLSDYVGHGQYVLVDFWASWLPEEVPNVVVAYKKYKRKGLQVVGAAIGEPAERSIEYVSKNQIPYPQMYGVKEESQNLYGVLGQHLILFGPDGRIIARGHDLSGKIGQKLEEIFK
jgi:hypothetical protein